MKMKKNKDTQTKTELTENEKVTLRRRIAVRLEGVYDSKTAMVRARYIDRWNGMCGGKYTLEHPVVHLEWELCDLNNQRLLMKGEREEFFARAKLTDEEKEIYLHGTDGNGDPYTYIENLKLRKETGRALKMVVKRKI